MIAGAGIQSHFSTRGLAKLCCLMLLGLGNPTFASHDKATASTMSGQDLEAGSPPASPASGSGLAKPLDPLIILGAEPAPDPALDQQFLPPDEAFRFMTIVLNHNTVIARWRIADTYYLYRSKFKFTLLDTSGIRLENISLPPGKIKTDAYFGRVEVYFHEAEAVIRLRRNTKTTTDLKLEVGYQGCTELGLCYPPMTRKVSLILPMATDEPT